MISEVLQGWLRLVSMAITSEGVTWLELERSRSWKASRMERSWEGGRGEMVVVVVGIAVAMLEVRVGEICGVWVLGRREGWRPRGVQLEVEGEVGVGVVAGWSLEGELRGVV